MDATWIITTFVLIDTAMTNLDHHTDVRAGVPDSEIITVALVAAKYCAIIIGMPLMSCASCSTYKARLVIQIESSSTHITRLDGQFA